MESIAKTAQESRLLEILENFLREHGFRIVDLDCKVAARSHIRIYVERISSGEGQNTSLDDCVQISRLIDPMLDAEFAGAYEIEVSSPGLDRRLRLHSDFERAVGREVRLKLLNRIEGVGANIRGRLLNAEAGEVTVLDSGREVKVALKQVQQAQSIWEFGAGN